jgi:hypothetical protein
LSLNIVNRWKHENQNENGVFMFSKETRYKLTALSFTAKFLTVNDFH